MRSARALVRLSVLFSAVMFVGCSDTTEPAITGSADNVVSKHDQSVSGLVHNMNVDEFIHNGSLTPTDFILIEGQELVVYVPLSMFGNTDPTHAVATLNGVNATSNVLVRGNPDFEFMDYTDDACMSFVFESSSLPPSTQKNTFTVTVGSATIVDDKSFSYSVIGVIEWLDPTVIAPNTIAWLDASAGKIYPSGLILKKGDHLAVIISNNVPGNFADFDFGAASLQGASESHVDLGHGSGWLNGINGMHDRHFRETADGETGHIIMHFDVSEMASNSTDGLTFDFFGKPLSFYARHRNASKHGVEIDFRDDGVWNFPSP